MESTKKRKRKPKVDTTTSCLRCGMLLRIFWRKGGGVRMVEPCKYCFNEMKDKRGDVLQGIEELKVGISELKSKVASLGAATGQNKIIQSESEDKG